MSVISESNKGILWEVLNGMIGENNLEIQDMRNFQRFFEEKCKNYHSKRFDYNGLSDINKHIVSDCFSYLKKMSQESKLIMFRDFEKYGNKKVVNSLKVGKRYEDHQDNFKKLMKKKIPGEIDFSENVDEPIGNMEDILSQTMQQREAEISNISQRYDENGSIKWLNSGGVPKLKIHNEKINKINLQVVEKKKIVKKVKFKSDLVEKIKKQRDIENKVKDIVDNEIVNSNMDKYFELMNQKMNKNIEDKKNDIAKKMDIIKEVERREKNSKEESKKDEDIQLSSIFNNMKVHSKDSDVEAAKTQTDVININKRIDKLETYLFDIMNNQMKMLEKITKLMENKKENDKIYKEIEYKEAI
jgi:hypothetical protein